MNTNRVRNSERPTTQLAEVWAARGVTFQATRATSRATFASLTPAAMAPPSPPRVASEADGLPLILGDQAAEYVLGTVLGEGGMGVVFTARQRTLERNVALKLPRVPATQTPEAAKALPKVHAEILREARTTGALEHPNIVPVHALGRDGEGRPVIVMKRIEGESWRAALDRDLFGAPGEAAATDPPRQPGGLPPDRLDHHIGILLQVASALHYAHSRGVVHRDVKPENVMLGAFGEVYLVDWGLAVSTGEGAPAHLPPSWSVKTIVGTPAYMAPEMAEGNGLRISARSDVYLLGALLHELLVGAPPHDFENAMDALVSAYESRPRTYPASVPAGLAAICRRAMAAEPVDRFADAGAFRDAVAQVRQTQGSVSLTEIAQTSLSELRGLVARSDLSTAEHERVRDLAAECQFAFAQALRAWPSNEVARGGLQEAIETRIDYELARHAPDAAELLLRELPTPRPELAERVRRAARTLHAERERLRRVAWDSDFGLSAGLRTRILVLSSLAWFGLALAFHVVSRGGGLTKPHVAMGIMCLVACAGGAIVVRWKQRPLLRNAAGRRIVATYFISYTAYGIFWLVAGLAGAPFGASAALMLVMSAGLWGVLGAFSGLAMAAVAPFSVLGALLCVWEPDWVFIWYALTIPAGIMAFALLQNRAQRRAARP